MKSIILLLLIIALILSITKAAMNLVKEEDRSKGLELDDNAYSIKGTLLSPLDQEKRLKPKYKFKDKEYDKDKWRKIYIILFITILISAVTGFITGTGLISQMIIIIMAAFIYSKRSVPFLILTDIYLIYSILTGEIIPMIMILPILMIINVYIIKDYKEYRKEKA